MNKQATPPTVVHILGLPGHIVGVNAKEGTITLRVEGEELRLTLVMEMVDRLARAMDGAPPAQLTLAPISVQESGMATLADLLVDELRDQRALVDRTMEALS